MTNYLRRWKKDEKTTNNRRKKNTLKLFTCYAARESENTLF